MERKPIEEIEVPFIKSEQQEKTFKKNRGRHLQALLVSKCISFLEIFIPIVFFFLLLVLRNQIEKKEYPEKSYVAQHRISHLFSKPIPLNITSKTPSEIKSDFKSAMYLNNIKICNFTEEAGGLVALSPPNLLIVKKLAKMFQEDLKLGVKFFDSKEAVDSAVQEQFYGSDSNPYLCFGIHFYESSNGKYNYGLRFNVSTLTQEIYSTQRPVTDPLAKENYFDADTYITSGFTSLQMWIDNMILEIESGKTVEAYTKDPFAENMRGSTDFYIVLPLIMVFLRLISRLLFEKEKKIREGMMMMGLSSFSFYASWVITYLAIYLFIAIIITTLLKAAIITNVNCIFFTRARAGIFCGIVFFFLFYNIRALLGRDQIPAKTKNLASISPHTALTLAIESMLLYQQENAPLSFSNLNVEVNNYKISTAFISVFLNIIFWGILTFYLDQVFPNEFGKKKHPLFFLNCFFKEKFKDEEVLLVEEFEIEENDDNVEDVDQILKEKENDNLIVKLDKLTKIFGEKKAVNNFNLTIYQDQIFALLGHNGAGKTTTISMLTGLLEPTKGTAHVYGKNIKNQMDEIRQFMGVCPQHDILFDDLTVKEHLELFASFKEDIPLAIVDIVKELDLEEKLNYPTKGLSGGQKRKLCVAIAFIGNSKLILLDEPTSGMDTSARRFVWAMLKKYKKERIVILTTHFMDEADFLGDRIAIMSEGKLACCGSSVFLKNEFGVGYNLTLVKSNQEANPFLINFIKDKLPSAKLLSEVSSEITFQLPLKDAKYFKELFLAIDERLEELGVLTYGVGITTLEEVFLKVAEGGHDRKSRKSGRATFEPKSPKDVIHDYEIDENNLERITSPFLLFFEHFKALFIKRMHFFKRDVRGLICEIIIPCILIVFGFALMTVNFISAAPKMEIVPTLFNTPLNVIYSGSNQQFMNSTVGMFDKNLYNFEFYNNDSVLAWDEYNFKKKTRDRKGKFLNNCIRCILFLRSKFIPNRN